MAFNGSGTFVRLFNWVADRGNGIKVRADRMDDEMDGFAAGISNCIARDGQTTVTADIPLNNKKITGLGDATGAAHAMNRQASDARFVRNPNSLGANETAVDDADIWSFWDTSASANKPIAHSNLKYALGFPAGTKMLFAQTAAPTGWTKDTTHNNKALRIVSGDAASGGSTPFTTVFAARSIARANLPNITLTGTTNNTGAHTHTVGRGQGDTGRGTGSNSAADLSSGTTSSNGAHSHTVETESINGNVTQTAMDFAVQYVDVILATRN